MRELIHRGKEASDAANTTPTTSPNKGVNSNLGGTGNSGSTLHHRVSVSPAATTPAGEESEVGAARGMLTSGRATAAAMEAAAAGGRSGGGDAGDKSRRYDCTRRPATAKRSISCLFSNTN